MKIVIGKFILYSLTYEQKLAIMTNKELIELIYERDKIYKKYKNIFSSMLDIDTININNLYKSIEQIFKNICQEDYENYYKDSLEIQVVAKNRPFEVINGKYCIHIQYMDNKQNVFTL